jgi:Rad3-related DNA helicase
VVQAAGRVIRTQHDEGVIYLRDDRFTQPEVLALLPLWWKVERLYARPRQDAAKRHKIKALKPLVSDENNA